MTALLDLDDRLSTTDLGVTSPVVIAQRTTPEVSADAPMRRSVAKPSGRLRVKRDNRRVVAEWMVILSLALGVALLVRHFVIQTFSIPSASMYPTLKVKDRLLVEKLAYQYRDVRRGEIIVFKTPKSVQVRNNDKIEDFVKRVVGLPGETVEIKANQVLINGKPLNEPYLPKGIVTTGDQRVIVPIDQYFVMGDNRGDSFDSRGWGTVPRSLIVGRVLFRVYPLTRMGSVR
jgi:signal peptidase I